MKKIALFLLVISFFILISVWVYVFLNFSSLPEKIPTHFNLRGIPDDFGSRNMLWLGLGISSAVFALLIYLFKNPQSVFLNIPQNFKSNILHSQLIVSVLSVITMSLFGIMAYENVNIGLGKISELSSLSNYIAVSLLLFILAIFIYSVMKKNEKVSS